MKTVSIVIPTYNRADMVHRAIESSLMQTYPCEVIVCDHGSTDNTPEVVQKYSERVKYIRREMDFGPHFCWLDGVLHSKSEFVHIQYDDDWIDNSYIEKMMNLMGDDVGFCFSQTLICDPQGKKLKELFSDVSTLFQTGIHDIEKLEKILIAGLMISPGACLYRRQTILDALYQGNLLIRPFCHYHGVGPDHFMTFAALLCYRKFGFCTEPLAYFCEHTSSITVNAQNNSERQQQLQAAYWNVKCYYKLLKLYNTNRLFRTYVLSKGRKIAYLKYELKHFFDVLCHKKGQKYDE